MHIAPEASPKDGCIQKRSSYCGRSVTTHQAFGRSHGASSPIPAPPDPAEAKGNPAEVALAFKDTYRMLNQRIGIFTSLPFHLLDQLSLQSKLREIGRMECVTAKVAEPT